MTRNSMSAKELFEAGHTLEALEQKYPGLNKLSRHQRAQFLSNRSDFGSNPAAIEGASKPDTAPVMLDGDQGQPRKSTYDPAAEFKALSLTRPSTKSKNIFAKLKGLPRHPPVVSRPPEPRLDPMEALRVSVRRSVGLHAQSHYLNPKPSDIEESYRVDPYDLIRKETRGTREVFIAPDGSEFTSGQRAEDWIEATMNLEARAPRKIK